MKLKTFIAGVILSLACGCAIQRTSSISIGTNSIPTRQTFTQIVWFQKANVEGLKAHYVSKTGSSSLSITKENSETQTEALSAVVQAAVQGAVKGAKP